MNEFNNPERANGRIESVSLVIPFFNEEDSVLPLKARLLPVLDILAEELKVQLVLVDDGSSDSTYSRLREHFGELPNTQTTILRHLNNRGIGAAMSTGFEAASSDAVCTLDCDCSYNPEELPAMIDQLRESGADIVTASPYHPEGGVRNAKPWRIFISKAASMMYSYILPTKLHCYTSLFRVYRREWAEPGCFEAEGFVSVAEILAYASLEGAQIAEYPTTLGLRVNGSSKMRVPGVTLQHLRLMARTVGWRARHRLSPAARYAVRGYRAGDGSSAGNSAEFTLDRWLLVRRIEGGVSPLSAAGN